MRRCRRRSASRPTTPTLARAVGAHDDRALAELYRRHVGPCLGLARRVLGDRTLAEEVVQEVFVRTWRDPERFDAEPRARCARSCSRRCTAASVDLLRAESARRAREEREALRQPERRHRSRTRGHAAHRGRGGPRARSPTLSDGEREAIELAYFGGHTYREVAVLLEQPEGTVKSRIRAGLLRLRAALIEAGVSE